MPRVCGLEESTADSGLGNSNPGSRGQELGSQAHDLRSRTYDAGPLHSLPYVGAAQIWSVPWGCGRAGHGPCRTGWGNWWCPWVCGETFRERARVSLQMGNAREGRGGNRNQPSWSGDANWSVGYPGPGRALWSTYGNWTGGNGSGDYRRGVRGGDFVAGRRASVRAYRTRGRETERGFGNGQEKGGEKPFSGVCVPESHSTALSHGREDMNRAESLGFIPTPVISPRLFRRSQTASLPLLRSSPSTGSTSPLTARPRTNDDAETEFWGWGLWIDNATGEIARWSAEPTAEPRESIGGIKEVMVGSTKSRNDGKDEDECNQCPLTRAFSQKQYHPSTIANFRAETPSSVFTSTIPCYSAIENVGTKSRMWMGDGEGDGARVAQESVRMVFPGRCIVDGGCQEYLHFTDYDVLLQKAKNSGSKLQTF